MSKKKGKLSCCKRVTNKQCFSALNLPFVDHKKHPSCMCNTGSFHELYFLVVCALLPICMNCTSWFDGLYFLNQYGV